MSAIHRLAGHGDPFELLAALQAGADPDDASGRDGRTPLMDAAKANRVVAVRLLLRFGAKPDVVDAEGRTPLRDASHLAMKRLLLGAGANPDFGRISGMTQMAFFASFRNRAIVDFFRAYGADTSERIRKGPTVQEALDDPEYVWSPLERPETPETRRKHAEFILRYSDDLRTTPERYVTDRRDILIWGLHAYEYDDPRLKAWATRVSDILASSERLEAAYRQNLVGDALAEALCSLERPKRRAERDRLRKARDAEFMAAHFPGEPFE